MLGGQNLGTLVFETGRPARLDHYVDNSSGPASYVVRKVGYDSAVGAPVIVEGPSLGPDRPPPRPWDSRCRRAPRRAWPRSRNWWATAIANADSRAELMALAQADRRRVGRGPPPDRA